jgi:hypothetical protein
MNGFVDAAEFGDRLGEFRRAVTNLEHPHDRGGLTYGAAPFHRLGSLQRKCPTKRTSKFRSAPQKGSFAESI